MTVVYIGAAVGVAFAVLRMIGARLNRNHDNDNVVELRRR